MSAEFYLSRGFLSRNIENRVLLAKILADLQQDRALADTRFASEQNERAFYETAAENTVQFADSSIIANIAVNSDIFEFKDIVAEIGGTTEPPDEGRLSASSSSKLFQAPQEGHFPFHFELSNPH